MVEILVMGNNCFNCGEKLDENDEFEYQVCTECKYKKGVELREDIEMVTTDTDLGEDDGGIFSKIREALPF